MASHILVAALIATVLAVCLLQVTGAPDDATTPSSIDDTIKKAQDSISKVYEQAKPQFDEFIAKGQQLFGKFTEEAGKLIPKTEEKPAA